MYKRQVIHFKTSNGNSSTIGHTGDPFYGDCIRYDLGPDTTDLDFRVDQTNQTEYHFYIYVGAFSGSALVEVTGGNGLIDNHLFTNDIRYKI